MKSQPVIVRICPYCNYAVVPLFSPEIGTFNPEIEDNWKFEGYSCVNCKQDFTEDEYNKLAKGIGGFNCETI